MYQSQVLQRRNTGKLDFMRRWREYMKGFGELTDEFWLGISNKDFTLLVIETFHLTMLLLHIEPDINFEPLFFHC